MVWPAALLTTVDYLQRNPGSATRVITDYLNAVRAIATARQPSFCFSTWHDKPARIYYYLIYSTLKAIRSLTHYTLFRWGKRDSPDCDYCGAILQDDEHIFVHCPRFDDFRNEAIARALRRRMEDDPAAGKRAAWERYVPAVTAYPDDKGVLTKYRIGQVTAPPPPLCCNLWCSHCDVSGSTTVVTYDGCIKNHERSENFPTMNERVARELIRAFQHSHSR